MKKIHTLLLLFAGFTAQVVAQTLYFKSETEIKGVPGFLAKKVNGTTYGYYTTSRWKTETTTMNSTQINYVDSSGAIVLNKMGLDKNCGQFSTQELANDSLDTDLVISDVKITHTEETKTLLGYVCKKVIITYNIVQTMPLACEMVLWCTDEITIPNNSKLPQINKQNSLTSALASLNSFPLLTETIMKINRIKTISTITELNTNEIDASVFVLDMKDYKKPLNLEEYKAMLIKRKRQAQMMGR